MIAPKDDLPVLAERLERQIDALLDEMSQLTEEQRRAFVERCCAAARAGGVSAEGAVAAARSLFACGIGATQAEQDLREFARRLRAAADPPKQGSRSASLRQRVADLLRGILD